MSLGFLSVSTLVSPFFHPGLSAFLPHAHFEALFTTPLLRYSKYCAGCFGCLGLCTKTECTFHGCLFKIDNPTCQSCLKERCYPAFITCPGLTPTEGNTTESAPDTVGPSTTIESTVTALPEDEWTQPVVKLTTKAS